MRSDQLVNKESLDNIPADRIPAALVQLAAAQAQLAARLLAPNNDTNQQEFSSGKLLKVVEAAHRMGCSKDWLYRNSKALSFTVRVGRSLKFSESGLEKWIRSRSGR